MGVTFLSCDCAFRRVDGTLVGYQVAEPRHALTDRLIERRGHRCRGA
jgi:hypothetical protein